MDERIKKEIEEAMGDDGDQTRPRVKVFVVPADEPEYLTTFKKSLCSFGMLFFLLADLELILLALWFTHALLTRWW